MIHDHGPQELFAGVPAAGRRPVQVHAGCHAGGISADLGVSRHTLYNRVHAEDTPTTATATTTASGGAAAGSRRTGRPQAPSGPSGPEAEIVALRARVAALDQRLTQTRDVAGRARLARRAHMSAGGVLVGDP
jgi:hypothetical protein